MGAWPSHLVLVEHLFFLKPWALIWTWSLHCCSKSLHSSGKSLHSGYRWMPGSESVLHFILEVFTNVKVRVLCQPCTFFRVIIGKPCLHGDVLCAQAHCHPGTCLSSVGPVISSYSIQNHSIQLCAFNIVATVQGRPHTHVGVMVR